MAQLQEKKNPGKGSGKRARSRGFHLDMTPMVDLASLLLTFFILTTTFARLQTMEINMPTAQGPDTPIPGKNALNIVLDGEDKVYYYFGFPGDAPEVKQTDLSTTGIRQVLLGEQVKGNPNLVVLVKATAGSRFKNLVDALDELKITDTRKYALVELREEDRALLATR
ncbi:ExbD/TolR family protein [Pontibacter virosus]|uniref:Outer membrane transport energization protein ExbD n=1 Tax=Pontibacter virosus TaxID=1765052 RepID=A0A2U1B0X4_9BACT|nr:biopolymer transporter ExbD [Pontibacter virosus]PVY42318.1 outer membrane transport energization protein ExbD [Pontibacter virosus]